MACWRSAGSKKGQGGAWYWVSATFPRRHGRNTWIRATAHGHRVHYLRRALSRICSSDAIARKRSRSNCEKWWTQWTRVRLSARSSSTASLHATTRSSNHAMVWHALACKWHGAPVHIPQIGTALPSWIVDPEAMHPLESRAAAGCGRTRACKRSRKEGFGGTALGDFTYSDASW